MAVNEPSWSVGRSVIIDTSGTTPDEAYWSVGMSVLEFEYEEDEIETPTYSGRGIGRGISRGIMR